MTAVDLGRELMAKSGNNLHELAKKSVKELTKTKGIGLAKAITIVAAMELGRRRKEEAHAQLEVIKSSQDVYELMKPYLLDRLQEEFWVILLNRANQVLDKSHISTGGISSTIVDPKVIFAKALEQSASGIILVHNHPSGQLQPSSEDLKITKKLQDGAGLLDIQLLDHVIFANQGYFSFADEGKL
jgi:DNA repair protein RadC